MKLLRQIFALLLVPILCSVLCLCAFAKTIELDKTGTISINMTSNGEVIAGGNVTIYRIGDLKVENGEYYFSLTEDFKNSNIIIEDVNDRKTAKDFQKFASTNKINGITEEIDENGNASFTDLPLGLYLLTQKQASDGYEEFEPFLITVPLNSDGKYFYDVDASPKIDIERDESDDSEPESTPPDIPQTGLLKWPIPILTMCGLLLFAVGWALCFRRKKD